MRVMVVGATGFIGPHVVARLAARGHDVLAVSRRGGGAPSDKVRGVAANRSDPSSIARLAREARIEAVIDLLAFNLPGTAPLLDALAGRIGRYVMASSGDVYRLYGALHRKEPAPPSGDPLDEDAPLRTIPYPYRHDARRAPDDPQAWMDDYDKIPVEALARAHGALETTIVRLPMVYGPGDRNRRLRWAIAPMRAGASILEVDARWAAWRASYGYVEDAAEGLALAATAAKAGTYNLAPLEAPDHLSWAARVASLIGWRGEVRTIPRERVAEPLRGVLDGLDLSRPFVMDGARLRRDLGFCEVVGPQIALQRTIEDEARRKHG